MTTISRAAAVTLICIAGSNASQAQTAERPTLKEGDKWVYSVRVDQDKAGTMSATTRKWETSITRAGANTFILARKPTDSNLPPTEIGLNTDWSVTRSLNGKNEVTAKPFNFPMQPGKTWKLEAIEEKVNPQTKLQKTSLQYTVVGWEDVKVPAGTFKALKIEVEGEWSKEFLPRAATANSAVAAGAAGSSIVMQSNASFTPPVASGRLYKAFWYVPEIKRDVKMIDEAMNAGGGLSQRTTAELESFSMQ